MEPSKEPEQPEKHDDPVSEIIPRNVTSMQKPNEERPNKAPATPKLMSDSHPRRDVHPLKRLIETI